MKTTTSVGIAVISNFLFICHFWSFASCDDCSNTVYIEDYSSSVADVPAARDFMPCDEDNDEGAWHRFEDHTGVNTTDTCNEALQCDTQFSIWIAGELPNNVAESEPTTVEVCASFRRENGDCCRWKENSSVKYCPRRAGEEKPVPFHVYQLKKPSCERGCARSDMQRKCTCPDYPYITEAPVLKPPELITSNTEVTDGNDKTRTFFPTRFVVDCVFRYPWEMVDDGARFDVVFEVNGRYLTHFTVNSINPVATLDESFLVGHLGKELTCKVFTLTRGIFSDIGSRYLISNSRWFGFNPVDKTDSVISGNLVVKEGEKVSLWMKPNFPITTRPCFDAPLEPCYYSSYQFQVSRTENVKLTDCTIVILKNSNRSIELEISPIPDVGARPKPVVWQLKFEPYNVTTQNSPNVPAKKLPIFTDYRIQGVNIEVRNPDVAPRCESTGDPHIRTFPFPNAPGTRNYYHCYGVGDFYLVRLNTSRLLEIQVRQVSCGGRASCNCGVIVREGNSIIGVTKCNLATPLPIKYELDKVSPTGAIHTIPGGWKISLLSGIEIKVTRYWWLGGEYMDLYVTGLKSELTQYDGLCSATRVKRDSECTKHCERYRVPTGKSFFNITRENLPPCGKPFFVPECNCTHRGRGDAHHAGDSVKISCEAPTSEYLLRIGMTEACSKKKRRTGEDDTEVEDDQGEDMISLEDFYDTATTTTIAPLPRPKVMDRWLNMGYRLFGHLRSPKRELSEEDGRRRCDDALRFSTVYDICSGRVDTSTIVKSCALDVAILNDYGPSKSVPTQFEVTCLDNIRQSLESYASSDLDGFEELKKLLERVEKLICPSQCSQRGRCVNSKCQCSAGFIGTDCSLRIGQVPVVQKVIMPVCDIRKHPCTQIHLVASDLTIPENVVCKMRSVDDFDGAVPAVQYSTPVISGGLVLCNLPNMPVSIKESSSGISTTTFLIQVSISNDGKTYSQELPFTVLDGHCMECPASQNTPCQPKANTCSIGGRCYRAEESCPQDVDKICNPEKCTTKWTSESSTNCDDGFENCT